MYQISKEIIRHVRSYPFLYDKSHGMYKNRTERDNAWKRIASDVKMKTIVVRQKWKLLRDKYVRYLRQRGNSKTPKDRALKLMEKWKPMQFLERHLQPKARFPRESRKELTEPTVAQQGSNADPYATELMYRNFAKSVRNMRCPVVQAKAILQIMDIFTDAIIAIDPNGLKEPASQC